MSPPVAVLRGKTSSGDAAPATTGHADLNPAAEASLVAADWHRSAESLILACVRIKDDLLAFGQDQTLLEAFLTGLVDGHVLSRAEAKLGRRAPKLVKLVKIGEHAELLRQKEISPFLVPSYSTIYQLVVLFEQLPKGEQGTKELARILAAHSGEISREYLSEETRRLKQMRSAAKGVTAARITSEPVAEQKPDNLAEAGKKFDLLLLTPREKDLAFLRADYADGSTLQRCLPQLKRIEHSAAAVIAARIFDLPMIVNVLLPLCGFLRLSRVLLARQPTSPDVTDADVFVTAQRGEIRFSPPEDPRWLDDADPIDSAEIAARLFPATSRRLHVFASAKADGWHCLVGDDSWAEQPSLR
jgi:hypothetical protein